MEKLSGKDKRPVSSQNLSMLDGEDVLSFFPVKGKTDKCKIVVRFVSGLLCIDTPICKLHEISEVWDP